MLIGLLWVIPIELVFVGVWKLPMAGVFVELWHIVEEGIVGIAIGLIYGRAAAPKSS